MIVLRPLVRAPGEQLQDLFAGPRIVTTADFERATAAAVQEIRRHHHAALARLGLTRKTPT